MLCMGVLELFRSHEVREDGCAVGCGGSGFFNQHGADLNGMISIISMMKGIIQWLTGFFSLVYSWELTVGINIV